MSVWFQRFFGVCAAVVLVSGLGLSQAQAHEGHAGDMLNFVGTKLALKQMLPEKSKITRRKERLKSDAADWAKDQYGKRVAQDVYTYYLAKDRTSGAASGVALVRRVKYGHGTVALAVGLSADGKVSRAAVLGIHAKYLPEVMKSVGKGFIVSLDGISLNDLKARAQGAAKNDPGARKILGELWEMAVVLASLQQQKGS